MLLIVSSFLILSLVEFVAGLETSAVNEVAEYETGLIKARNSTTVLSVRADSVIHGYNSQQENDIARLITVFSGCGFVRGYSLATFTDSEWPSAEGIHLFLRTRDDKELFSNSWVSLDSKHGKIVGFPMPGNYGEFIFLLCAENREGRIKKRKIKIEIVSDKVKSMHNIVMKFESGFREFVSDPIRRLRFASALAEYLRKRGIPINMQDIWLTSTNAVTRSISWVLATYNSDSCSNTVSKYLPEILIAKSGLPHPEVYNKLKPFATLSSLAVNINIVCPTPTVPRPIPRSNTNLVVGPILLILIVMGLCSPILFAYFIRRGIRKREFSRACSVRHVYTNGNATQLLLDHDDEINEQRLEEERRRKLQYRWSPDLSNRQPVFLPRGPPPRPRIDEITSNNNNSIDSIRRFAWHGLPMDQCAELEGVQLADIVESISWSASTLKNFFTSGSERGSVDRPEGSREDDSFSVQSDGTKLLETALKKVSSYINMSNFSTPTLIRISRLDIDNDSVQTRKSSEDTKNSSFECSVMSTSDHLTPSQFSSGVNSFDTEFLVSSTSFSQDDTSNEYNTSWDNEDEVAEDQDVKAKLVCIPAQTEEMMRDGGKQDNFKSSCNFSAGSANEAETAQTNDRELNTNGDALEKQNIAIQLELKDKNKENTLPQRKHSLRKPLTRMPPLQLTDNETDNENAAIYLYPCYTDDSNVHIQQHNRGMTTQYYLTKIVPRCDQNESPLLQNEAILEYSYEEDIPTLV